MINGGQKMANKAFGDIVSLYLHAPFHGKLLGVAQNLHLCLSQAQDFTDQG
jgi:hypothetical protein